MNKETKKSNKCPICERPTHKKSKYCIFHASVEEKTEGEFKKALKEYVDEIKKEDDNYNFEKFIFVGSIDFKNDLDITIFKNAFFGGAIFEGDAGFRGATFREYTDFRGATFREYTDFRGATFKGPADLNNVTFKRDALFVKTIFREYAVFRETIFEGDAVFSGANFERDADFSVNYINKIIDFSKIRLFSGMKLFIKIINKEVIISFERACLENAYLDIEMEESTLVNFNGALIKNATIKRDQIENHILQEKMMHYYEAQQIYSLLKNNFHSIGQDEDEDWASMRQKDIDRILHSYSFYKKRLKEKGKKEKFTFLRWIKEGYLEKWTISAFSKTVYGYGEKPWNVIFSAGLIIILFALFFSVIGIANPEIIELNGTAIHQDSGNIVDLASKGFLKNNVIRNFPDSLYFSLTTFTTLGYGDFRPLEGIGRILAGSEAFIGAFMMALFVYTFARRTGGR